MLTALQAIKLGLVWKAEQLPGVWSQKIYLQNGVGRGGCQDIPHGVVFRNGLGLACQPDVPPVAGLWNLQNQDTRFMTQ